MPTPTPELGLEQALDADDNADYLTIALANSLVTIDSLFNATTGHTHGDVHQGGPIHAIPASAIPDGAITSAKIADGAIATVDLADGCVTAAKLATGAVTSPAIAHGVEIVNPILDSATLNSPAMSNVTCTNIVFGGTLQGGTWQYGPTTVDWFRVGTLGQGIYNDAAACGIGIDNQGGPFVYGGVGGGYLISASAAQTLTNKTINSCVLNSPTINNSGIANTTLNGTVGGTPTWSSPQSFPAGTKIGGSNVVVNNQPSNPDYKLDSGTMFFNAIPNGQGTQQATNFNAAFTATPHIVATLRDNSGGVLVQRMAWEIRGAGTNGFYGVVDNETGSTQSVWMDWIAFGH